MNAIQALEGAIEMLTVIKNGKSYSAIEFLERLQSYEGALLQHRQTEQQTERLRREFRELADRARSEGVKVSAKARAA